MSPCGDMLRDMSRILIDMDGVLADFDGHWGAHPSLLVDMITHQQQ